MKTIKVQNFEKQIDERKKWKAPQLKKSDQKEETNLSSAGGNDGVTGLS